MNLPLVSSLLRKLGLNPRETRLVLLMGALAAVLLGAYTLAKVVRDALYLAYYGALALPYAYVGVAVISAFFVWVETRVARRLSRSGSARFTQSTAIVLSILTAIVYPFGKSQTTLFFYLWSGSQLMLLLPRYWITALEVWDSRRARRVFPLLTGFGLLGGLAGGGIAGWLTPVLNRGGLLWVVAGLLVLSAVLSGAVERQHARRRATAPLAPGSSPWEIVRRSRYIQFLAVGLGLSVAVSTLVDFQFKYLIQGLYPDPHALTAFLGRFYVALNALALLFQFGLAGWLLQRLGLAAATGLEPTTVLLFASWVAVSTGAWIVIAMRWIQGVVFQTLGKSSAEIYYSAIHPRERRSVKPVIDTLVDRWADALVGVLLVIALHVLHVRVEIIAFATAVLAAVWLLVVLGLNRDYARAFREALSARWIDPDAAPDSVPLPQVRRILTEAIKSRDETRLVSALGLCVYARNGGLGRTVRGLLDHPSLAVRAAALKAMEAMGVNDPEGKAEKFLDDSNESVRAAAISYLIGRSPRGGLLARRLLEGDNRSIRQLAIDALLEHPLRARPCITPEWVQARLRPGDPEAAREVARALGCADPGLARPRLGELLGHADPEVKRAALLSVARQPDDSFLPQVVQLLLDESVTREARFALAAIGDAALPALAPYLEGRLGEHGRSVAAHALADLGTRAALRRLVQLARSPDVRLRHLGLTRLARARVRLGREVLPRSLAHRLFLREMREYQAWVEPGVRLRRHREPEIRLLAESCLETADMALARGLQALACWYEPAPLFGAFDRLRSRQVDSQAPVLEYLGHMLPKKLSRVVEEMFEQAASEEEEGESARAQDEAHWIRMAWREGDGWLKACALRAARKVRGIDAAEMAPVEGEDPLVSAEREALLAQDRGSAAPAPELTT